MALEAVLNKAAKLIITSCQQVCSGPQPVMCSTSTSTSGCTTSLCHTLPPRGLQSALQRSHCFLLPIAAPVDASWFFWKQAYLDYGQLLTDGFYHVRKSFNQLPTLAELIADPNLSRRAGHHGHRPRAGRAACHAGGAAHCRPCSGLPASRHQEWICSSAWAGAHYDAPRGKSCPFRRTTGPLKARHELRLCNGRLRGSPCHCLA